MQFIFPPQRGTIAKKKFCQYCKKETVPLSDSESIYHTLGNLIWQLQWSITEREKKRWISKTNASTHTERTGKHTWHSFV